MDTSDKVPALARTIGQGLITFMWSVTQLLSGPSFTCVLSDMKLQGAEGSRRGAVYDLVRLMPM